MGDSNENSIIIKKEKENKWYYPYAEYQSEYYKKKCEETSIYCENCKVYLCGTGWNQHKKTKKHFKNTKEIRKKLDIFDSNEGEDNCR